DIILEHLHIGWRRPIRLGQGIEIERAPQGYAAFFGNLLHQAGIRDVFNEYRGDFFLTDLLDKPGDVAGGSLALGAETLGGEDGDAVGGAEITEGVVGSDH